MSEISEEDIEYRDAEFIYSIKSDNIIGKYWYVHLYINCFPVFYQGQSDRKERGFRRKETAIKYLQLVLKQKCAGKECESKMKALPLFIDGYTPELKFE